MNTSMPCLRCGWKNSVTDENGVCVVVDRCTARNDNRTRRVIIARGVAANLHALLRAKQPGPNFQRARRDVLTALFDAACSLRFWRGFCADTALLQQATIEGGRMDDEYLTGCAKFWETYAADEEGAVQRVIQRALEKALEKS
jgi:hypothetical protein